VAAAGLWSWRTRRHKPAPAALMKFKRGEEFARRRTAENIASAIGEYSQAVTIDPLYAEAWGGLADAYSTSAHFVFMDPREARTRAEEAAQRALSLDPHLAKAHSSLAYLRSLDLQKWRDADPYFRKALQSYADEPLVHVWYAAYLGRVGRHDEAVAQARAALGLDPASMSANHQLAVEYFRAGRISEYLAQARELVRLQPLEASGRLTLTRALEWSGDFAGAEEELKKAVLYGSPEKARSFEITLRAAQGRRAEALELARTIRSFWEKEPLETNIMAGIYGSLGLSDDVADVLEQGYQRGDSTVLAAATNPYLRGAKQNPRVQAFLRRLGY
jgi:tetratricopeptide (TPR) repeat protein